MKKERNLFHRVASLMLAVVMVFSVIGIMPKDVNAAIADKVLPANGGSVTITANESMEAYYYGEYIWISYTAAKDGYLKLTFSNSSQSIGTVVLCNANGTPLSNAFTYDTNDTQVGFINEAYGVKKGTAYRIRVYALGGVTISAKFTASKKKQNNNAKKGKAINLKKKKKTVGVITSGTTTAHWYKFKVTKNQKLNIGIKPCFTGRVKLSITGPRMKYNDYISSRWEEGKDYVSVWGKRVKYPSNGKVSTGTYYIQIQPVSRDCGGYFEVDWK